MDTLGSSLSVRLRGTQSRPLSQDSVRGKSAGDSSSPDITSPAKAPRVVTSDGANRGTVDARTPLTTTASSRPTVDGNSPLFPETPTPPAKLRHNKGVAAILGVQQQQIDIAAMAVRFAESRRKLEDRQERNSASSQASKANSRRAERARAPVAGGRPVVPLSALSASDLAAHE